MSAEQNKALVRRGYEDAWNKQNLALFDELLAADLVDHSVPPGIPQTREGSQQVATMYWKAFPDVRIDIEDQVAEGDKVVTRWTGRGTHTGELMGIAPTGKQVVVEGISIDRVVGGKIVETWGQFDQLGMLQQLGAVPVPEQTAAAR
jgi:steroid delta-isomerase-like uncharacterized protein